MMPQAPAFSPVTDSPITTGQPGYVAREEVPRSPYTRTLPATKEPGLWSAEVPRAISDEDRVIVGPYLPAVRVVLPDDDEMLGGPAAATPGNLCRELVTSRLRHSASALRANPAASEVQRRCLAAMLLATCMREIDTKGLRYHPSWTTLVPDARRVLDERHQHFCKGADATNAHDAIMDGGAFTKETPR